jgi:hypothetical protein
MALAARKHRDSVAVDRQPKSDGDKRMVRVHNSTNSKRTQMAATQRNTLEKLFDSNEITATNFLRLFKEQKLLFSQY